MKLTPEIHLVGSGRNGLGITDSFDCNVYLLDGGSDRVLIDAGAGVDMQPLVDEIARSGFQLAEISQLLLTHKHADHSGGAAELQRLTGARVGATAGTAATVADAETFNTGLARARSAGIYPTDYMFQAVDADVILSDGDTFAVGELEVHVLETPGHCAHHCSFVVQVSGGTCVFTGDALFPGGAVMLQPIADCSIPDTVASLEKLGSVGIDMLMAGHGAPVLADGERHLDAALARIRDGKLPLQLLS